ncbi:MAG: class I SAM-dependent methyltransferase [Candidatus Dojkabacteria bacterium]
MALLKSLTRKKRIMHFLDQIHKDATVLDIGCGDRWAGEHLRSSGVENYTGLDLANPAADIVGDILKWKKLGLKENSFDYILLFEVIEHVDCMEDCFKLLKPGGKLMLTSPVPHFDWVMKILERVGLNQKRTSPHSNLIYFDKVKTFTDKDIDVILFVSQFGIFTK